MNNNKNDWKRLNVHVKVRYNVNNAMQMLKFILFDQPVADDE